MIVFGVGFEMLRQIGNSLCQNGDLNFRRTGVAVGCCIFFYQRLFALFANRHLNSFSAAFPPVTPSREAES